MNFLSKTAPWNSPVVSSIPLPPFRSNAARRQYMKMLQLHLALLDVGGPALPTVALSAAINQMHYRNDDFSPWLTSLELSVSLDTWFPAPWTPEALAASLENAGRDAPKMTRGRWSWDSDPVFSAEQISGGAWKISRNERGSVATARLDGDRNLVVLLMDYYRTRFVLPWGVGYQGDDRDAAALAPATLAVLQADIEDARYPYRAAWLEKRSAFLTGGRKATNEETD
ncbi:hypothetical protein [Arthrobacter sp. GMC3]|uniref:hypothetical protein n=1 Tax=Arthrobacter sp. GMC3 TaxID=2058894 RepID=UPI0011B0172C|nr:hypothetical protein [Arthrobacter sp. GMC3]